jgi:hypothetical protein
VGEPFQLSSFAFNDAVGMDVCVLQKDAEGYEYILVLQDLFTRFVVLHPLQQRTAEEILRGVMLWVSFFGPPRSLLSDQGRELISGVVRALLTRLGTTAEVTTAGSHQQNGILERSMRELRRHLLPLTMTLQKQDHWNEIVPIVQHILNSVRTEATGRPPAELVFGPNYVNSLLLTEQEEWDRRKRYTTVESLTRAHEQLLQASVQHLNELAAAKRRRFEKAHPEGPSVFEEGSWVLATWPDNRRPSKMHPVWRGPFRFLAHRAKGEAVVHNPATGKEMVLHVSTLRPYDDGMHEDPRALCGMDQLETVVDRIKAHRPEPLPRQLKAGEFLVLFTDGTEQWLPYIAVRSLEAYEVYMRHLKGAEASGGAIGGSPPAEGG